MYIMQQSSTAQQQATNQIALSFSSTSSSLSTSSSVSLAQAQQLLIEQSKAEIEIVSDGFSNKQNNKDNNTNTNNKNSENIHNSNTIQTKTHTNRVHFIDTCTSPATPSPNASQESKHVNHTSNPEKNYFVLFVFVFITGLFYDARIYLSLELDILISRLALKLVEISICTEYIDSLDAFSYPF